MDKPNSGSFKVAIVWRGDAAARAEARAETSRLRAIFEAPARRGVTVVPVVYFEEVADAVRAELLAMDGVLVWVDPIATATGQRRSGLDDLLREVAAAGVFVSTHPDVIARMGVKAVLHWTRSLGWGTDTRFYETAAAFRAEFPERVAAGAKVLKQNRGNGGIGVWKVETADTGSVCILEATGGSEPLVMPMAMFMAERIEDFAVAGGYVEQPFQPRLLEGMVRCYMSGGTVAGFGHQLVRALAPPETGPAGPRLYSGPEDVRFQRLRGVMEDEWTPGLARLLEIAPDMLPVIWDADFLLGPKTAQGEDSYVLCEINVSSVFPIPDEAPEALAATTLQRLAAAREKRATPARAQTREPGESHA